jgi:hypothetical protein
MYELWARPEDWISMKFLLSKITVQVLTFDGEIEIEHVVSEGNKETNWTDAAEYQLGWTEGGALNPQFERDKVLAAFLKLLSHTIERADYEKPRIISVEDSIKP